MKRVLHILLITTLWTAVVAYIVWAGVSTRRYNRSLKVSRLEISIVDSTAQGHFVTSRKVRRWLSASGLQSVGTQAQQVQLQAVRNLIARNGFVSDVEAYITRKGVMHINVSQRDASLRLVVDGYNSYVGSDGYVFRSPPSSALYVPVVSGSYRPPMPASYEGNVADYIAKCNEQIAADADKIGRRRNPLYRDEDRLLEERRAERRRRCKKGWFEDKELFAQKVAALKVEKKRNIKRIDAALREVRRKIDAVTERETVERDKQKKLAKRYADFCKLINFVELIENDDYWRSEVVQIVVDTSSSGELDIRLVPRSGNHTIVFGEVDNAEQKLSKLLYFYKNALSKEGWDSYSTINVRYKNQVVCAK